MKHYITSEQFKKDYLRGANLLDQMDEQNVSFFIGLASSRVDTNTNRFVEKAINSGLYTNKDGALTLNTANIPEDSTEAEEEARLGAIKEAVATYTKFGTDTGFDLITGSIAVNLGSESFQETLDFETSFARVERMVKELLATFDFQVLLEAGGIKIAYEGGDDPYENPAPVNGEDRAITLIQYKTHHAHDHIAGEGIVIVGDEKTGTATFSIDANVIGGDLSVDDTEILATEAHITDTEAYYG